MVEQFSVTQFFHDGTYETVRKHVMPEEAMRAFAHYTDNVTAKMGLITRVIITDGGDMVNMEWKYVKGIVFPPPEKKP